MSEPSHSPPRDPRSEHRAESEQPRYPYVAIDVGDEEADDAGALLFELGATGIEQRDATTLSRGVASRVTLVASFARESEAQAAAAELPVGWGARVEAIIGDAWRDEWKKYFEPFQIAPGIVIAPPWRDCAAGPGETVLVLEPGRAFGTGLHETTRLVAEALSHHADLFRGLPILDVGCGSGVLSLVAIALGASSARAVDLDPEAVLVTRENATRNGMGARVRADQEAAAVIAERYVVVVANIESRALIDLAPALTSRLAPRGLLILSGILATAQPGSPAQLAEVRRAYPSLGQEQVRVKGEWVTLLLRGP